MAEKQINIVIGADIDKLEKGFKDAVTVVGASGKKISSEMDATVKSIEKDFERIANSPNTKRTVAQLQNLALKVQALGPEFQDMSNKIIQAAGKIKDKVADAGAQIQYFSSDTRRIDAVISSAQGVAGAFGIAEGAAALFGGENEELQKTLMKVQGAIAIMNGIQAVQNVLQQESAFMTGLNAAAQQVLTIKTYASASAMNALKVALIASGIGVAIVLIASLASAMNDASDKGKLLGESIMKANKAAEEAAKAGFESQKSFTSKRVAELGKELQAQGKSNDQILKAQLIFIKKEKENRLKEYSDIKINQAVKGAIFKEYLDLRDQQYGIELDMQIAANESKKKANEEAIKADKEFLKAKGDLNKLLFKEEINLKKKQKDEDNKPEFSGENRLLAEKTRKEQFLKFNEEFANSVLTNDQNFNGKKFTVDMKGVDNLKKTLAANQSITNERIKQRERDKEVQDKYIADNEKFVEDFNKVFANIQTDALTQIGQSIGDALMNGGNVLESVFSIILNSVASFADAYGKALIAAAVASEAFTKLLISNPVLAIGAGIALVAAGAVVRSVAQKGVTAFADGGIVSGPTLGLMGEYPGASTNPEVIAPLSKLQGMLAPQMSNNTGTLETRISGRDLLILLNREERAFARG
jgi:hypothetical protein